MKNKLLNEIKLLHFTRHKPSQLDALKEQILLLIKFTTYKEVANWLKLKKSISTSPSRIHHMVKQWNNPLLKIESRPKPIGLKQKPPTSNKISSLTQLTDDIVPKTSSDTSNIYRQKRRYNSKLDPYRLEIITLRYELNQSVSLIKRWLLSKNAIQISETSIHNRLKYWRSISESAYETEQTKR